jgi:hypothetical protein
MPRGPRKGKEDLITRSAEFIGWALGGLEREIGETRSRLTQLTAQAAKLRARLGRRGRVISAAADVLAGDAQPVRKRRRLSREARERIAAAQRKRWAEHKKAHKAKA